MQTATLHPAEDPTAEIVVVVSPVPVDALFDCVERAGRLPRTRKEFAALATAFAPYLESWSFDPPATADGLGKLDFNLVLAIVNQWAREVALLPLPLLVSSSGGDPSPEASPGP